MPDIAVSLAYWDINPQFYLHIAGSFPQCALHLEDFEERTPKAQHLHDLVPQGLYDFMEEILRLDQVWGILTRESVVAGYGSQFKIDVNTTLNLRHPFTANLQPLITAAENRVGVAHADEINRCILQEHPNSNNKPLTPELKELGKRFTIAIGKMTAR